jgi:hypothetical protein
MRELIRERCGTIARHTLEAKLVSDVLLDVYMYVDRLIGLNQLELRSTRPVRPNFDQTNAT